jgi:hypothetical protein
VRLRKYLHSNNVHPEIIINIDEIYNRIKILHLINNEHMALDVNIPTTLNLSTDGNNKV